MPVDIAFITNQRYKKYQSSVPMHSDRKKNHTLEEEKGRQWISRKLLEVCSRKHSTLTIKSKTNIIKFHHEELHDSTLH
jgi:hypothetical protein